MDMLPQWHLGYNETLANFHDGLDQLGLDYVDLYMFHWPGMYQNQLPMLPAKHPDPYKQIHSTFTAVMGLLQPRFPPVRARSGGVESGVGVERGVVLRGVQRGVGVGRCRCRCRDVYLIGRLREVWGGVKRGMKRGIVQKGVERCREVWEM